jgi:hypothetical protein
MFDQCRNLIGIPPYSRCKLQSLLRNYKSQQVFLMGLNSSVKKSFKTNQIILVLQRMIRQNKLNNPMVDLFFIHVLFLLSGWRTRAICYGYVVY